MRCFVLFVTLYDIWSLVMETDIQIKRLRGVSGRDWPLSADRQLITSLVEPLTQRKNIRNLSRLSSTSFVV